MKSVFPITFNINFNTIVDLFCNLLPISLFQDANATCVITGDTDIDMTGFGGGGPAFCVTGVTVADPLGGKVWFELTIDSASEADSGAGVGVNLFPSGGAPEEAVSIIVLPNFGGVAQAFVVTDFGTPPPYPAIAGFTNFNFGPAPYTIQYRLDTTTGEVSYEDTAGNGAILDASMLSIIGAPFTVAPVSIGLTGTTSPVVSSRINVGYSAPVITPPIGYDTYCSYLPIPPPIQCAELVGIEKHYLVSGNLDVPLGMTLTQVDNSFSFENESGDAAQTVLMAAPTNYNLLSTPAFIDLTYTSSSQASYGNVVGGMFATVFGGFFLIGVGIVITPRTESNDGGIGFFGGFVTPIRILGSQLIIEDTGGLRTDEFVLTWVSGGGGDIFQLGFQVQESIAGSVATDSVLSAESEFSLTDYSVTPLVFDVQLGANPVVQVTLTGNEDIMSAVAASIQSQLQAFGGAYLNVTVGTGVGMNIVAGYNLVMGVDLSSQTLVYEDSLGNSDSLSIADLFAKAGGAGFETILALSPLNHYLIAGATGFTGVNNTIDMVYNAGKYFPAIDLGAVYRPHCQLTEYVMPYSMSAPPFSSSQQINSVIGRLGTVTNDIGQPDGPALVGVFRDLVGSSTTFEGNCFEAQLTTKELGTLEEQWTVGINATLEEDIRLAREGAGYIGNSSNTLKITAEYPVSISHTLANNLPAPVVDDVMTICVFPNLLADPTPFADKQPQAQFIVKIGADIVIYDRLYVRRASTNSPLYAFTQLGDISGTVNDNLPDAATAEVTFNGLEGDYHISTYPDGVVDYKGDSMALDTVPWIRSAEFAPWNIEASSGGTIVYSNSNKTIAITSDGVNANGVEAHLPLFIPATSLAGDVVVVGMRVDVAPVGAEFELTCTIAQTDNPSDIIRIYQDGADLRVDTSSGLFGLGTHTLAAGDEIYLELQTDLSSEVIAYLWDGVSVTTTPLAGVNFNGGLYRSFIVQMETKNVPVSTTSQFTSLCKAADIDVGGNITFKALAQDIEGVAI